MGDDFQVGFREEKKTTVIYTSKTGSLQTNMLLIQQISSSQLNTKISFQDTQYTFCTVYIIFNLFNF